MKRKLIRQTLNQWRSNLWLIIEMTIVSCVIWIMVDWTFPQVYFYAQPLGVDPENVLYGEAYTVWDKQKSYRPIPAGADTMMTYYNDLVGLKKKIAQFPEVEAVGLSVAAMPFNHNFWGSGFTDLSRDSMLISGNFRLLDPEAFKALGLEPVDGQSVGQHAKALADGKILISRSVHDRRSEVINDSIAVETLIGDTVQCTPINGYTTTVGGIVEDIRREDFEEVFHGVIVADPIRLGQFPNEFIVKLKPGTKKAFFDRMNENPADFRSGNAYLPELVETEVLREDINRDKVQTITIFSVIIAFFLVSIFLGLLGTFWFRTQERTGEIAIRIAGGATRTDIFRRMVSEGLLLLIVATVLAAGLDALCIHFFLQADGEESERWIWNYWNRLPVSAGITFVLMAIMVVLGIWFPARRATRLDPAEALRTE